jgi:hypothetical protein
VQSGIPDGAPVAVVAGYRLRELVGPGGMRAAWLASVELLVREVALKQVHLTDQPPKSRSRASRRCARRGSTRRCTTRTSSRSSTQWWRTTSGGWCGSSCPPATPKQRIREDAETVEGIRATSPTPHVAGPAPAAMPPSTSRTWLAVVGITGAFTLNPTIASGGPVLPTVLLILVGIAACGYLVPALRERPPL